jgi:hypothetical protein
MEEEDEMLDAMSADEKQTFAAQFARAEEVRATRRKAAAATGDV